MPAKKSSAKTSSERMRSFKVAKPDRPFMSFKLTHQTFYWVLISLLVLALGAWVTVLTIKVQSLYDRIEILKIEEKHQKDY